MEKLLLSSLCAQKQKLSRFGVLVDVLKQFGNRRWDAWPTILLACGTLAGSTADTAEWYSCSPRKPGEQV